MSSQHAQKPLYKELFSAGVKRCHVVKQSKVDPTTPKKPLKLAEVELMSKDRNSAANILWAPKRPRLIRRLNRDKIEPRRLFEEDEEEENEGPVTPKRSRLSREHLQRLLMAPKRLTGQKEKNPNIRPVRLFQSFDQGYMTDEDFQSDDGQGDSLTPDRKPLDDSAVVVD